MVIRKQNRHIHPAVVAEFREKLQLLQRQHPPVAPTQGAAQWIANEVIWA